MKFVNQSYKILKQANTLEGIYRHIEKIARVCYKSEDRIAEGSANKMVENLIKRKHYAMLEHGTVYLKIPYADGVLTNFMTGTPTLFEAHWNRWKNDKDYMYITTNYRHIIENRLKDMLKYLCEPTEHHAKRMTVKFVTSIGIARELLRHRVFSFANESTRYCNYSSGKFGEEIVFVKPYFLPKDFDADSIGKYGIDTEPWRFWLACRDAEKNYKMLAAKKLPAQAIREVLPLCTKSELVMTGFETDWRHVFDLRVKGTTGAPHPDIKRLLEPLYKEMVQR